MEALLRNKLLLFGVVFLGAVLIVAAAVAMRASTTTSASIVVASGAEGAPAPSGEDDGASDIDAGVPAHHPDHLIDPETGQIDLSRAPERVMWHIPFSPSGDAWIDSDVVYGFEVDDPANPRVYPMYLSQDGVEVVGYFTPLTGEYHDREMKVIDIGAGPPTTMRGHS